MMRDDKSIKSGAHKSNKSGNQKSNRSGLNKSQKSSNLLPIVTEDEEDDTK